MGDESDDAAFDLFDTPAADPCEDDANDDAQWEVVKWAGPSDVLPQVTIHRKLAQCWESARLLSEWLLGPGRPVVAAAGLVVEMGASLGLPSLAASVAGAGRCLATDLYPSGRAEALLATIAQNRRLTGNPQLFANVESRRLDWFKADAESQPELAGAADLVLCADVIYERRAAPAIAAAAALLLRRGGTLVFVSRYGRMGLDHFLRAATAAAGAPVDCGDGIMASGCGLAIIEEIPLHSETMGLGLTEEEKHGLWLFEKQEG